MKVFATITFAIGVVYVAVGAALFQHDWFVGTLALACGVSLSALSYGVIKDG
jgi:hypothetical protein